MKNWELGFGKEWKKWKSGVGRAAGNPIGTNFLEAWSCRRKRRSKLLMGEKEGRLSAVCVEKREERGRHRVYIYTYIYI